VTRSFNARYWYEPGRYLFDVIDGDQGDGASLRPNQILNLVTIPNIIAIPVAARY